MFHCQYPVYPFSCPVSLYPYEYSRSVRLNPHHYSRPESVYSHPYFQFVSPYSQLYSHPYPPSVIYPYDTVTTRACDRMKVTTKEITVFQFPQYSADIDRLPPAEKAKMDALAKEIADSFILGKSPIVAFVIAGHADRDPNKGADFEMKVSVTRAEAAQTWLIKKAKELVQQQGGNPSDVDSAEFSLFGYGASNLYTTATTFPEREKNRRIVVKYASVELDPLPDAVGYGPNLARLGTLVQLHLNDNPERMKRIQCALTKLANPLTDDTYFDWETLKDHPGGLGGLTDEQILVVARKIIKSLRRHIANNNLFGFQVPDDLVINNILKWEENVRDVNDKIVKQHGIPGIGQIHKSVGRYIARNQDNPNSILSCFKNT